MTTDRPHFPGLEGLRAIAAGLVVFTHAAFLAGDDRSGVFAAPGRYGDIGVSVFFVLSGFLIYRPFASAHLMGRAPTGSVKFWWRRALRIFPAYWLALTVLWGLHHFQPFGFVIGFELGPRWWKYYLLLQIYDPGLGQGGIAQSWSVATEITFYLLIPLWSLGIRKLARRRPVTLAMELGGVALLFSAGYLSRWWFSHSTALMVPRSPLLPDGVSMRAVSFTWLPNQIDLFAIGMVIAVLHVWSVDHSMRATFDRLAAPAALWWAAALGLFFLAVYGLGAPPASGYIGTRWQLRQVLYGGVGLTLVVPLVFGDLRAGLVRRFVNAKPMWWMGTVSYGFYLWHLDMMERLVTIPTFVGPPEWQGVFGWRLQNANFGGLMVAGFALGLGAAAISWYGLERPLGRFRNLVGRRRASEAPAPDSK